MKRLLLIVAVIALLSPVSFAQIQSIITANVPFDFYAGQTRMPAGEYRLSYFGSTGDILLVANQKDGKVVAIMSYREGSRTEGQNPKLVFHNYGQSYFLARVLMSANDLRELPQTRDEREFSTEVRPEEVTVVARLNK